MKYFLLILLITTTALAGFPPTTSKVSGDSTSSVTFNYEFPYFSGSRSGTTTTLGTLGIAGGGTGASSLSTGFIKSNGTAFTSVASIDATSSFSGNVPLNRGGTGNSLSASAGSLIYSTSTSLDTTAVGSSGQLMSSNGTSAPSWTTATYPSLATNSGRILRANGTNWLQSTATYPDTTTANQILYSSAANTIGQITAANTSALVTDSSGVPSLTSGSTANRVLRTNGSAITFSKVALSSDVSGTLGIANGGTGATSLSTGFIKSNGSVFSSVASIDATTSLSGNVPLNRGGTGNSITASAGSLIYSTSASLDTTAVGSSGQILTSNGSSAPSWTTATYPSLATNSGRVLRANGTNWLQSSATYPDTTTANQILYSSATNTISEITAVNTGALVTNSSGVPSLTSGSTANRVLRSNGSTISFSQVAASSDISGLLPLANGGTNHSITAAAGGVVYSGTASLDVTAAGSSGQILRSAGAAAPAWSTATYPATTTANQILYSSAANTVGGISSAATSVLVTNSSSTPAFTSGTTPNRVLRTDGTTVSFSQVTLSTDVTGALPIANGGTNNGSIAVTAGGLVYTDGTKFDNVGVGSSKQYLKSNGSTAPTWANLASADGSIYANSTSNFRMEWGTVTSSCTSTPCTIAASTSGVTSVSRASGGTYTINFSPAFAAGSPICHIIAGDPAVATSGTITTSAFGFTTRSLGNGTGTPVTMQLVDSTFYFFCIGVR